MNHLRVAFAPYWQSIQHALFPQLERVLGPLTEKQQQLVQTLEVIRIEQMIPRRFRVPGRPPKDRAAMARALVAKAVYDMPTTRVLLDRLDTDVVLRRICGWERRSEVPSESVFSRAFAEFSDTQLPQRVHEALIWNTHRDRLVGHLSRDSTAIEAREKPAAKEKAPPPPKRKRGRLKKGEERPKVLKRLDRQATMSLPAMLDDLPTACDVGGGGRGAPWPGVGRSGVAAGRPACQRATRVLRCAAALRVTHRPSLRSSSRYGPCGPAWTGASRPSTTTRKSATTLDDCPTATSGPGAGRGRPLGGAKGLSGAACGVSLGGSG